jgi:CRISPR/Cas system-associated endoribonuclease Cas2
MPLYMISYDLRKQRNYEPLLKQLRDWGCARILESVWLGDLRGPSETIRDLQMALIDSDDGLAVLPLAQSTDWATFKVQPAAADWLRAHIR